MASPKQAMATPPLSPRSREGHGKISPAMSTWRRLGRFAGSAPFEIGREEGRHALERIGACGGFGAGDRHHTAARRVLRNVAHRLVREIEVVIGAGVEHALDRRAASCDALEELLAGP